MIEIIVHGEPAPQGSKRYVGRHGGRVLSEPLIGSEPEAQREPTKASAP